MSSCMFCKKTSGARDRLIDFLFFFRMLYLFFSVCFFIKFIYIFFFLGNIMLMVCALNMISYCARLTNIYEYIYSITYIGCRPVDPYKFKQCLICV